MVRDESGMRPVLFGVAVSFAMGCSVSSKSHVKAADSGATEPLRIAFIADTHVIGPQYECCSEGDGLDNASIMKTPDRLAETVAVINAIDPPPEHVFLLGDVVHAAHHGTDFDWYIRRENAFSRASALLSDLNMPLHILWGNHDYEVVCGGGSGHHSRAFTHRLFSHFFGAEPYGVVDAKGWRFVMLNSQLGETWSADSSLCSTGTGSYGEDQLAWLNTQLEQDRPTIVMSHHHMLSSTLSNENNGPHPDISTVLGRHENVIDHISGHFHRWLDLDASDVHPARHLILGATRYDTDNFWVADLGADGSLTIVDYEKAKWMTTCADTWQYADSASVVRGAVEEGDCGT